MTHVKMGSPEWNNLANEKLTGSAGNNYGGKADLGHKEGEQTFGDTYKGQQQENEYGVVALLQTIQNMLETFISETSTSEKVSLNLFERLVQEIKVSSAKKTTSVGLKTAAKVKA